MSFSSDSKDESIPVAPSLITDMDVTEEPVVSKRVFFLSMQVILNAIVIGFLAKALVALINMITNISFYG